VLAWMRNLGIVACIPRASAARVRWSNAPAASPTIRYGGHGIRPVSWYARSIGLR
jgi:hypothetical protein